MKQTITLRYAGFSLYLLADIVAFHSSTAFSGGIGLSDTLAEAFAFASIAARIATFLAFALVAARSTHDPLPRRLTPAIATVVALIGIVIVVAIGNEGAVTAASAANQNGTLLAAIVCAGALFGGAQGIMGLVWLTTLPSFSYRGSYLYLLASHAIATTLCAIMLLLPSALLVPALIICMLGANACAAMLPSVPKHDHPVRSHIGGIAPFLWKGVLAVGVFAFLSGFVTSVANRASDPLDPVGMQFFVLGISAAVIVIMLVPALAFHQPLKLENGYKIALPLSALGFLILPGLVTAIPAPVAGVLATTGYMLTGIILSCTIAEIARAADVPSSPLFAGSDAITLTCLILGTGVGSAFATRLSEAGIGVALIGLGSLYLIAIVGSSFMGRQRTGRTEKATDADGSAAQSAQGSGTQKTGPANAPAALHLAPTLDDIADELDFTEQERQIFLQLIEGRTIPRIAQDLYLSASTVKYHTQKIYRRFDVHSRPELVAAVERKRGAEDA